MSEERDAVEWKHGLAVAVMWLTDCSAEDIAGSCTDVEGQDGICQYPR